MAAAFADRHTSGRSPALLRGNPATVDGGVGDLARTELPDWNLASHAFAKDGPNRAPIGGKIAEGFEGEAVVDLAPDDQGGVAGTLEPGRVHRNAESRASFLARPAPPGRSAGGGRGRCRNRDVPQSVGGAGSSFAVPPTTHPRQRLGSRWRWARGDCPKATAAQA